MEIEEGRRVRETKKGDFLHGFFFALFSYINFITYAKVATCIQFQKRIRVVALPAFKKRKVFGPPV
jgi:hypothetical protein